MPDDRMLHRCQGQSDKLAQLDDLAYRVWTQYLLSADDFGIMPFSASVVRGANRALRTRTEAQIEAALRAISDIGLVVCFEHQGETYCCSLEWQDYQHIRWPRKSHHPAPSAEVLRKFSRSTSALFQKFSRSSSEKPPRLSPSQLLAVRTVQTGVDTKDRRTSEVSFDQFWSVYPKRKGKAVALKAWGALAPTGAEWDRMERALRVQAASVDWTKDGGQYIPFPATWLRGRRWEDESDGVVAVENDRGKTVECVLCHNQFGPTLTDQGRIKPSSDERGHVCERCRQSELERYWADPNRPKFADLRPS